MFKQNPNYRTNLRQRQQKAGALQYVFSFALLLALLALLALLLNVVNHVFGYVANDYKIQPSALSTQPLESLSSTELVSILRQHISTGVQRRLDSEKPLEQRPQTELLELLTQRVLQPKVVASYTLSESLFQVNHIKTEVAQKYPTALLTFRSWLNWDFLRNSMSNDPLQAGIRTAIAGSLWVIMLTILMAFPAGVGAAVWLQEYNTSNTWIKRVVQTNIDNLAGVPSIIYGILGLAVFVRTAGAITSGNLFGSSSPNGRTILSAALTMAMLILPVIIINAQEALRAVPSTLRQASFGLGATRWQTIWYHVLPRSPTRHYDRHHFSDFARHRRNSTAHCGRCSHLDNIRPHQPIQSVHRFTDPNLQLDIAPTSRISFHCLGGDYGVIDHFIITKRRCHLAAQPF
jgi:phosphate transport system permease protein